jgi:hypothetical protein
MEQLLLWWACKTAVLLILKNSRAGCGEQGKK